MSDGHGSPDGPDDLDGSHVAETHDTVLRQTGYGSRRPHGGRETASVTAVSVSRGAPGRTAA